MKRLCSSSVRLWRSRSCRTGKTGSETVANAGAIFDCPCGVPGPACGDSHRQALRGNVVLRQSPACHPLSKRGRLGVVNPNGSPYSGNARKRANQKAPLAKGRSRGAPSPQARASGASPAPEVPCLAMQRGGSPVSKGALGSRSCGNAARPLRTVGLAWRKP